MVLGNTLGKEAGGVFPSSLLLFVKDLLVASSLLPGMSGSSLLAVVSGLLVEELLATGSLLAGASGLLVKELLATGSLLAGASGLLVEELLAVALVRPQIVKGPLPGLIGAFSARVGLTKRGSPLRSQRQQPSGLLVFAEGTLMPFLPWTGEANAGRGVVGLV